MYYSNLNAFLYSGRDVLRRGPLAVIFIEDQVEIDSTLRHHLDCGFRDVVAIVPDSFPIADDVKERVHRVAHDVTKDLGPIDVLNRLIASAPGIWMYYCFNAEYLFYPFCETRTVGELITFHTEERRDAMLCFAVDLYASDLTANHNAVSLEDAYLDRSGYYALARKDPANNNETKERQLDFFGGLRWRYEEHVPQARRKIDRIALFKARPRLMLRYDFTLTDEECNTFACPWHNNMTAVIASFRTAKALKNNPGSSAEILTFQWHNSEPFEWHSRQLLDLGLMEPGQWF